MSAKVTLFTLSLLLLVPALGMSADTAKEPRIVEQKKIWDRDPHSAFTDLIRFKGRWLCVFRTGKGHVSPDGAIQVLTSSDGKEWAPLARITSATADLRDPKISITPEGKLMIVGAASLHQPSPVKHQSMVWFSDDGKTWDRGTPAGDPNVWLWRVTWHKGTAYGVGYSTVGERFARLYSSKDGKKWTTLVDKLFTDSYPNCTFRKKPSLAIVYNSECLSRKRSSCQDCGV